MLQAKKLYEEQGKPAAIKKLQDEASKITKKLNASDNFSEKVQLQSDLAYVQQQMQAVQTYP